MNPEDISQLCELACLAVDQDQMADVSRKLTDIVDLVNQLQSIDTAEITPMAHPLDQPQRLRDDQVTETDQHERYQANAPSIENGLYLVPKVIE